MNSLLIRAGTSTVPALFYNRHYGDQDVKPSALWACNTRYYEGILNFCGGECGSVQTMMGNLF
jgi:hypothetical protein